MSRGYELIYAVRYGRLQRVKDIIDTIGLCYAKEWEGGYILLLDAIENKHTEIAKLLLLKGARVNRTERKSYNTPIHLAAYYGNVEIIKMLLDRNAEVNATDKWNRTPLYDAVKANQVECVELLLNHGANVNVSDNEGKTPLHAAMENWLNKTYIAGYTPLHFASAKGSVEIVQLLLSKGADVNAKAKGSAIPLFVAVQKGHENIVKLLLDHGANVNAQNENGYSVLYLAVERGNLKTVEHILNFRPDVNNRSNRSSLHNAIQTKFFEGVERLLNYGFTLASDDVNNCMLMLDSVENGYLKIVEDLLQNGADVNMTEKYRSVGKGDTLLHIAIKNKQGDIVKLLLNYRADINAKNANGRTPIFYALEGLNLKFVKLLLNNGAIIKNIIPRLLHNAVEKGCMEIVDIILQHDSDIDINAGDEQGQTALHFSALENYVGHSNPDINIKDKIARLLLSKGANVNSRTEYGTTPLHAAVEEGQQKLVETLLEYNSDVNSVDANGTMPIHSSAEEGNVSIMKMLINKVADINAKDGDGYSALHIATLCNHKKLVEIFLKYGADYDSRTKGKETPLHIATKKSSLKNVLNLLKFGANINATDSHNRTVLQVACENNIGKNIMLVSVLLENGADINVMDHLKLAPRLDRVMGYPRIFDNFYHNGRKKYQIAYILVQHIVKLKAQNLFVNEIYSQSISNSRVLADFYTRCESEVIEMRCEKIGNSNVAFYDILTKDINQLAMYTRNEDILHVLESQVYRKMFPRYAKLIHYRFSTGQERQYLLNSSARSFNLLIGYKLPEPFTNQMIRYLSVVDLENLIEAYPTYNNIDDDDHLTSMQGMFDL